MRGLPLSILTTFLGSPLNKQSDSVARSHAVRFSWRGEAWHAIHLLQTNVQTVSIYFHPNRAEPHKPIIMMCNLAESGGQACLYGPPAYPATSRQRLAGGSPRVPARHRISATLRGAFVFCPDMLPLHRDRRVATTSYTMNPYRYRGSWSVNNVGLLR